MTYEVIGSQSEGFAVIEEGGGTIYDLIDRREEAEQICRLVNLGIGPDWSCIEPLLTRA